VHAFARHCAAAGAAVAVLTGAADGGRPASGPVALNRSDVDGLRHWLAGRDAGTPVVVAAGDLTSLPDAVADLLGTPGAGTDRPLVLGSGTAADLARTFRGPGVALRRSRTVLLLRPAPGDAELLGLRTPRTPLPPRPGSGWLVTPTRAVRVQVARRRSS